MSKTIKLSPELRQRVKDCAEKQGYSSPQEFIEHLIEKELSRHEESEAKEEVERRLKGLGYLE